MKRVVGATRLHRLLLAVLVADRDFAAEPPHTLKIDGSCLAHDVGQDGPDDPTRAPVMINAVLANVKPMPRRPA